MISHVPCLECQKSRQYLGQSSGQSKLIMSDQKTFWNSIEQFFISRQTPDVEEVTSEQALGNYI